MLQLLINELLTGFASLFTHKATNFHLHIKRVFECQTIRLIQCRKFTKMCFDFDQDHFAIELLTSESRKCAGCWGQQICETEKYISKSKFYVLCYLYYAVCSSKTTKTAAKSGLQQAVLPLWSKRWKNVGFETTKLATSTCKYDFHKTFDFML